jgi:hypothetical protein
VWRNLIGKHQPGGAQIMTEPSLYERLGGAFAIAAMVDRFSDALVHIALAVHQDEVTEGCVAAVSR